MPAQTSFVHVTAISLRQPESVVALRGENPAFHCQGNGPILWHINNTLFDHRSAEHFSRRGVRLETSHLQAQDASQDISVQTSTEGSNNTNFSCTVLGPGNETSTSHTATLVIIGESLHWPQNKYRYTRTNNMQSWTSKYQNMLEKSPGPKMLPTCKEYAWDLISSCLSTICVHACMCNSLTTHDLILALVSAFCQNLCPWKPPKRACNLSLNHHRSRSWLPRDRPYQWYGETVQSLKTKKELVTCPWITI